MAASMRPFKVIALCSLWASRNFSCDHKEKKKKAQMLEIIIKKSEYVVVFMYLESWVKSS